MMHLAPDGVEGREYTADKIYEMLMKMSPESFDKTYGGGGMDNHEIWAELPYSMLEDVWNHHLKEVAVAGGVGSGIPSFMARYLKEITHAPRTNWRQILHDFIQFDKSDYDFCRPDRRLLDCAILPSFCDQLDGGRVEKLWFLVDTSGSVSDEALSVAYEEIKQSASQIDNMSGMLSFFDHRVSEPIPFESLEDILEMKPIGGGGTSFYNIFKKLGEFEKVNELPNVMVIITDGYDTFPEEEMALGVPVIWMIVDSEVVPPWGTYAYISTSEEDER
ncbi:MAG: hypothetical protein IJN82_06145 [Clostridia bacterium]|nr:hypothetical protein [Clostridia bacterium]